MKRFILLLLLGFVAIRLPAGDDLRLDDFSYPFPVQIFRFTSQRQEVEMAYMDVPPAGGAAVRGGGTVVLLHGKNFSGAYWEKTAKTLSGAGYRVIIPDQIGFGKSSKPEFYQFSFQQLATNTRALLQSLDLGAAHIVGHSMGGMIAARYALMFPSETQSLTLVNPLGLEDWKAAGVPYLSLDKAFQQELAQTPEKIRAYQEKFYYDGKWKPEYESGVEMLTVFLRSPNYALMAWNQALTSEMIFTQPVVYELGSLEMPVLLIIGQRDRTAPGRERAPADVQARLGDYPVLGRKTAAHIPHAKLIELEGLGHLPHVEAFPRFIVPLQSFLDSVSNAAGR